MANRIPSALSTQAEYEKKGVIQRGKGKHGTDYLRITNVRTIHASRGVSDELRGAYESLCVEYLAINTRAPKQVEIQRLPGAILLETGSKFGIADFDDGAVDVGTRFCLNHQNPLCSACPLEPACLARNSGSSGRNLIERYST